MNQFKKTTFARTFFAVLGIGAAVAGAWGLRVVVTRQPSPPPAQPQVIVRGTDLVFDKPVETGVTVYPTPAVCPTPEPSSVDPDDRTPDGRYFLEKCKKCGQVYKIPAFCTFTSTEEERKHFHTTPEEEAQMVKLLDKWEKDPASLEKDLGLRHTTKEKP